MARYTIAIDVSRCSGCGSCLLACKDEHVGNDHPPMQRPQPDSGHNWLDLKEIEQGQNDKIKVDYIPVMCQHCAAPSCAKNAPEGAVVARGDGLVVFDPVKSAGCKDMVKDCAYNAVFWNDELGIPQKCDLCAHMLDSGEKTTRCVEACPTGAMFFGDIDDPDSEISKYIALRGDFTSLKPEKGTKPTALYRELPVPFITGEIVLADKPDECCEGAAVKLSCAGSGCAGCAQTATDFFGDFQFKGLKKGEKYTVTASFPGYKDVSLELILDSAKDLGVITLSK